MSNLRQQRRRERERENTCPAATDAYVCATCTSDGCTPAAPASAACHAVLPIGAAATERPWKCCLPVDGQTSGWYAPATSSGGGCSGRCGRQMVLHQTVGSGQRAAGSGQQTSDSGQWTVDSGQWTTDRRRVCVGVCVCACVRERGRGRRTTRRTGTGCQGVAADGASRQLSGRAPASAAGQRSGAAGALPVVATVPQPACLPLPPTGLPGCPAAPAAGLSPARSMPVARPPPRTLSAQPAAASSPATWRARAAAPAAPMVSCTMLAGRAPAPPRQQAAAPTEQKTVSEAVSAHVLGVPLALLTYSVHEESESAIVLSSTYSLRVERRSLSSIFAAFLVGSVCVFCVFPQSVPQLV